MVLDFCGVCELGFQVDLEKYLVEVMIRKRVGQNYLCNCLNIFKIYGVQDSQFIIGNKSFEGVYR